MTRKKGRITVRKNTTTHRRGKKLYDIKKYQVVQDGKVLDEFNDIGSAHYNANYYRMKQGRRYIEPNSRKK